MGLAQNNQEPHRRFKLAIQMLADVCIWPWNTGYQSIWQGWYMMPLQLSEKGSGCCKLCCSSVVPLETALPHKWGAHCLHIYHMCYSQLSFIKWLNSCMYVIHNCCLITFNLQILIYYSSSFKNLVQLVLLCGLQSKRKYINQLLIS